MRSSAFIRREASWTRSSSAAVGTPFRATCTASIADSFSLGSFSDAGPDSPWTVTVDWGDSSSPTVQTITGVGPASGTSLGNQSHIYADGPNNYTVSVSVKDKNGGTGVATFSVAVFNVAPTVT